ncbi:ATP F0F1 synthase subunit gamma [Massilia sp. WF1]|uniref:F0F1 ATP synthase subunit gamma n=1 Tax=unclassified Massilia TaxID=2609279 RepID=UPI00064AF50D|nr:MULTISPECIES: F0F1 ATP synthase subunit gamma [unclassified Massilia]ALK96544.1 ATP F0F1 synthase subunit gamma [Massilia sp. WG5]KLU36287.1 ATP F0F1 synthase subunit gamma [Massilia sp. WF1]
MAGFKEIRTKIKSVESTRKITKAMEMVAVSKMRKAQDRMRASRPYAERVRNIAGHLAEANPDYTHPFLVRHEALRRAGLIVVTTDKGLCGGMNVNVLRLVTNRMRQYADQRVAVDVVAVGGKGFGFLNRFGAHVVSQVVQLGDVPHLERLIGPVKVLTDAYQQGELDEIRMCYTRFVNTMAQEPAEEVLIPMGSEALRPDSALRLDYITEPDAQTVIDELVGHYVEALIYRAVAENMASEQAARRMAMKAATDNAGNVIGELTLKYNKSRQASITQEITEIVSGAAAV